MAKRADLLNLDTIRVLSDRVRFVALFQKTSWVEYLALIVQLYDAIEDRGEKVSYSDLLNIVERFYFNKEIDETQKGFLVMNMFINELGVLREIFIGGQRYVDTTKEGKQLLHWITELSRNRPQFTGAGAETLVSSLRLLISDPQELTVEEAVEKHNEIIRQYRRDIDRIKEEGIHASELLNPGIGIEELYQRADEEAGRILFAAEDVKLAIESCRKELTQHYLDSKFSAGDAVEFIADFAEALRGKPEYQSYRRAKEILSHIEGVGALSQGTLEDLIYGLERKKIVARHVLHQSSLYRFSEQFQTEIRSIEEKHREQLHLLKVQVQYALSGNTKQTREDLMALHGLFLKQKTEAVEFLTKNPLEIPDTLPFELGALMVDDLIPTEEIHLQGVTDNGLGSTNGDLAFVELLKQFEESTIERILKRLQGELDQSGSVELARYPIQYGLGEYYVLSRIECFSRSIAATEMDLIDIAVECAANQTIQLRRVKNFRYELVQG